MGPLLINALLHQCFLREGFQGVSQEGKASVFCMNWKIKCNWGSGGLVSPSVGLMGDQGPKH